MSRKQEQRASPRRPAAPARRRLSWRRLAGWYAAGLLAAVPCHWLGRGAAEPSPTGAGVALQAPSAAFVGLCERGEQLLAAERYSEALTELQRAAAIDPSIPIPYWGMGQVYRKLALQEKAEEAYRRACALDPNFVPARNALAMVLHDTGKHEEALEFLGKAAQRNPNDSYLWAEIALNLVRLGKPVEAIPLLERYNAVEGRQAWGYANLGRAYAEAGRNEAAEKAYREAIAIDPRMSSALFWLGQLLITLGKKGEAETHLEAYRKIRHIENQEHLALMALLRTPDDIRALRALARARYHLGKGREALIPLEKAIELAPGDEELNRIREQILRSLGNLTPRDHGR